MIIVILFFCSGHYLSLDCLRLKSHFYTQETQVIPRFSCILRVFVEVQGGKNKKLKSI